VALDRSVRLFRNGRVLVGGHPGRLITLSAEGAAALAALRDGGTTSEATGRLARRLVDAGMAHPRPSRRSEGADDFGLTVVVPTRDRADDLDACLESLGHRAEVIVVDDASDHPAEVAAVCRHHRARLIRRTVNGGPGVARNQASASGDSGLVAFVDSDATVGEGWPEVLVALFDDPDLGAAAPRIRPSPATGGRPSRSSLLARFTDSHSSLDMGPDPEEVGPDHRLRYVPTAALVVRRAALDDLEQGFDAGLRVGEDVDLVWRLVDAGWRVRYEPTVTVRHREPASWRQLWSRRFLYGTSAGPLARRHPGRLAPVELRPWPTVAAVAVLTGRYRWAAAVALVATVHTAVRVRGHGIPLRTVAGWNGAGIGWTIVGLGRAATVLAAPLLIGAACARGRVRRAAALLLLAPPAAEWVRRRPAIDPLRWTVASVADDASYGAGVWVGCLRARTFGPLLARFRP
jgi:mycofactocin system glycosyltransferase